MVRHDFLVYFPIFLYDGVKSLIPFDELSYKIKKIFSVLNPYYKILQLFNRHSFDFNMHSLFVTFQIAYFFKKLCHKIYIILGTA